jgi:uncharacterized membrane protein
MLTITLYARKNDQASLEAKTQLEALQDKYPHRLVEVDVDSDPVVQKNFGDIVPSVEVGPYRLNSPFDKQKLSMTVGAAYDRRDQLDKLGREDHHDRIHRAQSISRADRMMDWFSRHYLALLNFLMFLYFGLPILAPVLMNAGATVPANVIYTIYKPLCHQFAFRSLFLFGEQPYYPLKEAGLSGIVNFEQATGIVGARDPFGIARLQAREFTGNPVVGYKMAVCERDMGIYSAIFLFGILYAATGRRLKPLHWMLWILIGLGPIGLDGFSQLFSQMEWSWLVHYLPYRESTPFLRLFTGALFGFTTAWFAYPNIEESMLETRQFFIKKFASVSQNKA